MTLVWTGEGYHGPMSDDPEDDDQPVLRFVVHDNSGGSWRQAGTGTTYLLATDSREQLSKATGIMLETLEKHAKKPDPFIWTTLSYIHLAAKGPQINVPIDSHCRSFTD